MSEGAAGTPAPPTTVEFRILGPLEALANQVPVDLGRPKQRALLALLLLHANQPVPLDRVIDLLWGPDAPAEAFDKLQVHVSRLRRALEPDRPPRSPSQILPTVAGGYLLRVGTDHLDADRFEVLADRAHRLMAGGQPVPARAAVDEALGLWRGPALAEFAYEPFAQPEAARLEDRRILALEDRFEIELALGNHAEAVAELEALVAGRGLRERLWGLLMLALYRSGRQGEALRAYTRARRVLGVELGVEPGAALRRLEADILAQDAQLDWHPPSEDGPVRMGAGLTGPPGLAGPGVDGGAVGAADRGVTAAQSAPPLIGRTHELAILDQALAAARAGRGRLVLVAGEAGIGKTRLASEVAAAASDYGVVAAWGRGTEVEGAPPFWFWSQIVRALLAGGDSDELRRALGPGAADIAQIVPEVTGLTGDVIRLWPAEPAAARFRLYEAVVAFVTRLAARRPLVLVLDDLHWADIPSLELTELLAQRIADLPVLMVVTYRDGEVAPDGPVASTLGGLARSAVLDRVPLAGLSESEVGDFVAQATGGEVAAGVAAAVHARTEGNPFYVAELARSLAGGGLADPADPLRQVPLGIHEVLRRRLAVLPGSTRSLLEVAAVAGREFEVPVVATAAEVTLDEAVEMLEGAARIGMVGEERAAVGRYRFSHVLVRDAIYEGIGGLRRAALHGRVGEALAGLDDGSLGLVTDLAHHFSLGAPAVGPAPGIAAAVRAAEAAVTVLAFEQAEAHIRQALALVATMPLGLERDRQELQLQLRLGYLVAVRASMSSPEVSHAFERAKQLCVTAGVTVDHLRTLWGRFSIAYMAGRLEDAAAQGEQLLALGRRAQDPRCELAGLTALGTSEFFLGRLSVARAHLADAAAVADAMADPSLIDIFAHDPRVTSRNVLGVAAWLLGDTDEAEAIVAEQLRVLDGLDHPPTRLSAQLTHGWLRLLQRDFEPLAEVAASTMALAAAVGYWPIEQAARMQYGWAIAHLGETHAGTSTLRRTLEALNEVRLVANRPCLLALLAEAELLDGRPDAALATVGAALAEVSRRGDRFYLPEIHRLQGEILLGSESNQAAEAQACFRRAVEEADAQGAVALRKRAAKSLTRRLRSA